MEQAISGIPQVKIADDYEQRARSGLDEPLIVLTLGFEQITLTAKEATELAAKLIGVQFSFLGYAAAFKRSDGLVECVTKESEDGS